MERDERLRGEIRAKVRELFAIEHGKKPFVPGESRVNYSGRVYDESEMLNLIDSSLDFWLTAGPYAEKLEAKLKAFFGANGFLLVNSGSSANLLMLATLRSEELKGLLREGDPAPLRARDEVITPAVTFPTTLAPILQNGLVPVFVDCELGTYNADPALLEGAVGPKTRAIFLPHTLGIPCDMDAVMAVAKRHNLWVLEDSCDALGAKFGGKLVGTFGAMAGLSFFPAHHMTMGEGGGVVVNHPRLKKTAFSIRDWGRDCWCAPGKSDTCGKRFGWKLGELPEGYDHKYIYSNVGYNLKLTDLQAAIGLAQVEKVPGFVKARRENFEFLLKGLSRWEDRLILPKVHPKAEPSPFGFAITVGKGIERGKLTARLESAQIETRGVFGGNILRQPGYLNIPKRVHGTLERSDRVMRDTFFIGVYPGLTREMLEYVLGVFETFFAEN